MKNYAFAITNLEIGNIKSTETNVYFVEKNMFSTFYLALKQASIQYVEDLLNSTSNNKIFFIFLIIPGAAILLSFLIFILLFFVVRK